MGFILSKLWGRESTSQQIERIHKQMVSIQDFKRDTKAKQESLTRRMNIFFYFSYTLAIILGLIYAKFYYQNPHKNMDFLFKFKICLGFFFAPITFIYLKKSLVWWFSRRLNKNEVKLKELRDKKYKILDEVTEKETFKVAREILEKYAPESLSKYGMVSGYKMSSSSSGSMSGISSNYSKGSSSYSSDGTSSSSLRHRIVSGAPSSSLLSSLTSGTTTSTSTTTTTSSSIFSSQTPSSSNTASGSSFSRSSIRPSSFGGERQIPPYQPRPISTYGPPSRPRAPGPRPFMRPSMPPPNRMPMGPPLPRPVVSAQKGFLGKIMDYVVGDGPGSRYALICNQCQAHNGMAQEETYEYTAYRCAYCHYWNPPKKQKPIAPKLVLPTPPEQPVPEKSENDQSKPETKSTLEDSKSAKESSASREESSDISEEVDSSSKKKGVSNVSGEVESKIEEPSSISEDVSNLKDLKLEDESCESENASSNEVTNVESSSDSAAQEVKKDEKPSEFPSDCESDIDIIEKEEALEAMEVDERSTSNLEVSTSDKEAELNEKE